MTVHPLDLLQKLDAKTKELQAEANAAYKALAEAKAKTNEYAAQAAQGRRF